MRLNVQKKIAMKITQGKQVLDCRKELFTRMVEIKTLTYLSIRLRASIGPLVFKSSVSWEVLIVRSNFLKKLLVHHL